MFTVYRSRVGFVNWGLETVRGQRWSEPLTCLTQCLQDSCSKSCNMHCDQTNFIMAQLSWPGLCTYGAAVDISIHALCDDLPTVIYAARKSQSSIGPQPSCKEEKGKEIGTGTATQKCQDSPSLSGPELPQSHPLRICQSRAFDRGRYSTGQSPLDRIPLKAGPGCLLVDLVFELLRCIF